MANVPTDECYKESYMNIDNAIESMLETVYCIRCEESVSLVLESSLFEKEIKGVLVTYNGYKCRCPKCNTVFYPFPVEEYNFDAMYEAYRAKMNIISLHRIKEIPEKYNIGIRPLSLVLGWGEQTFSRYYNGELPSAKYSDLLKEIYDNPKEFRRLLCLNSSKITEVAMKKSLSTVDTIIGDISEDKILVSTACYICSRLPEVSALALQKLLYYIDGFYSAMFGASCFSEPCCAWARGPVYPTVYYLKKEGKLEASSSTVAAPEFMNSDVADQLKEISDSVIKYFGCFSGDKLTELTHSETPWILSRKKSSDDIVIQPNLIRDYFTQVIDKYKIRQIQMYASEIFRN